MAVPELVKVICPRLENFALFFEVVVVVIGKSYLVSARVCEISFDNIRW